MKGVIVSINRSGKHTYLKKVIDGKVFTSGPSILQKGVLYNVWKRKDSGKSIELGEIGSLLPLEFLE